MYTMSRILLAAAVMLLAGCATLKPEQIPTTSTYGLCLFYADHQDPAIRAELTKRGVFNDADWKAIDGQQVFVGEHEDAVYCTYGVPYTVNNTVTAGGTQKQIVYQHIGLGADTYSYVYTASGLVTAFQF